MSNVFNWSDLQTAAADAGFSLVPAGAYDVEITKAEAGKTSTQKDKISCRFKIQGGPENGNTFFEDFVISPDSPVALGFFFRHMAVFGLDKAYFAQNPPVSQVAAALVGRMANAVVEVDYSYFEDGKNKIKKLSKIGSAPAGTPVVRSTSATPLPGNDIFAAPVSPPPAPAAVPQDAPPPPPLPEAF